MSIKCPKCNTDNPDTLKFCGECGTQLPSLKDIEITETLETPKEALTRGTTLADRYEIIEELGQGGMGRVYRVEDTKLKQEIALKLVRPEIAKDKKTIERFRNELKTARMITHKNVCRMFDLGESEGAHFITMEFIRGEDLKSLIRKMGQLSAGQAITIAKQVCDGLNEAHRLGVVHRDLKPQNVMIDTEGNARIMDFGIARSLEGKGITGAGVMIGTPEYMSPEQVEGKETDQRSDIYSLGVILYEMVTGQVPFKGDSPFTIGVKHKSETPQNPKEINTLITEDLSRVILKCLEKDKERRYQSAGDLRSEFENIERGIPTTERIVPKRKPITSKEITVTFRLKKLLIPSIVVVALAVAAVIIWQLLPKKEAFPPPSAKPSIAVLPFADLSSQKDQEYLCDGMTDEIIARLSRIPGWKVMNRASVMRYKNTDKDIKVIGQELNVITILGGSVQKEQDDIRVSAQLINVADSFLLWSDVYERKFDRVFEIQSDIAEEIAKALKVELSTEEEAGIKKQPTENLEAYDLYLRGRYFWNMRTTEGLQKSLEYFQKTIEKDPTFALAYTGIADYFTMLGYYDYLPSKEAFPRAKAAAEKALEIDDTLAEAHASLAHVKDLYEWDWQAADLDYRRAIELNPSYATAHFWHSGYLAVMGRFEESIAEYRKALELDPFSVIINVYFGTVFYLMHQYDLAIEQLQKSIEMDLSFYIPHFYLAYTYVSIGKHDEAIAEAQKAIDLSEGREPALITTLGYVYAAAGKQEEAKKVLSQALELSKQMYISPFGIASIFVGLGQKDKAFEWLEKAYEEHDHWMNLFKVHRILESLHEDPRYTILLRKMNLD